MNKIIFTTILLTCLALTSIAQEGEPGGGGEQPLQQEVPIDGGLTIALAGVAAYGVRRVKQQKQQQLHR